MNLYVSMLICLVCTIIIETTVAYLLKLRKTDLIIVVLVNIFTNPLVVSINNYFSFNKGHKGYIYSLIILELFALISETIIYKFNLENKKINPFILSLILNTSSYIIGLLINNFML